MKTALGNHVTISPSKSADGIFLTTLPVVPVSLPRAVGAAGLFLSSLPERAVYGSLVAGTFFFNERNGVISQNYTRPEASFKNRKESKNRASVTHNTRPGQDWTSRLFVSVL